MTNVREGTCKFVWNVGVSYWIGLDVTYTKNKQEKVFSNGVKWRERKHGKIYRDYNNEYTDCAHSMFDPSDQEDPFAIGRESRSCRWTELKWYVCLKPAGGNATSESVVRDEADFDDLALTPGVMFAIGAMVVLAFAVGAVFGARFQKRKELQLGEACVANENPVGGNPFVEEQ